MNLFSDFSKIDWVCLGFLGASQGSWVDGEHLGGLGRRFVTFGGPWWFIGCSFGVPWGSLGGPQEAPGSPRGGAKRGRKHNFSRNVWGGLWWVLAVILVIWGGP